MFTYALANAFRRKGISLLAILGVALGTTLMTILTSLNTGIHTQLAGANHLASEIVVAAADAPMGGNLPGGTPLPYSEIQQIQGLPHVTAVQPLVVGGIPTSVLPSDLSGGIPFVGTNIADPQSPAVAPPGDLLEGRGVQAPGEIVVGAQVNSSLHRLGGNELHPGSVVKVYDHNTRQEIDLTVVGVFETHDSLTDGVIYGDVQSARRLVGLDADQVTALDVQIDDPNNASTVARAIADQLQGMQPAIQTSLPGRAIGELSGVMDLLDRFLVAGSIVAAVAGGMSIFIIMLLSVTERYREFGILKASGWSPRDVLVAVLIESLTLSLFGADAGFAVGALAVGLLRNVIGTNVVVISPLTIVEVGVFTLLVGMLGGVLPALRAARGRPVDMLKGGF